jgi:tRNA (adenine22-N1)-methyltransferase
MQLSKRLQAVADLVSPGNRVADIGCDHAYTSVYLAKNKISPHIIAMDINQGPIDRAKTNILKYGCNNIIETRKSNGLEKLEAGEADTIIIAGMGGALTNQILTKRIEVMKSVRELVLQPQSEIYKVRRMLTEQGFIIINENMLKEDGKYYVMMKAVPIIGAEHTESFRLVKEEQFHYGRLLLDQKNPVLLEYLLWDLDICRKILTNIENEQTENAQLRVKEMKDRIQLITCGLEYYKEGGKA